MKSCDGEVMKRYDVVLFDLDGTILDSSPLIKGCYGHLSELYGFKLPEDFVKVHMGLPLIVQLKEIAEMSGWGEKVADEMHTQYVTYQFSLYDDPKNLPLYDGWIEALNSLKAKNKIIGIVTSRHMKSTLTILDKLGIRDLFEVIIGGDSSVNNKPHPEPVNLAIKRLSDMKNSKISVDTTLFVGDAKWDILCGKGAGVSTCLVNWAKDEDAFASNPDFVLESPLHLVN